AVRNSLPADIAIFAAAVADWRSATAPREKIKKSGEKPSLDLIENADILATVSKARAQRPTLVIGFAAETGNVTSEATKKRKSKGADWIVANDVSPARGAVGGGGNTVPLLHARGAEGATVHLITADGAEDLPTMSKDEVARRLMQRAAEPLGRNVAAAE